MFQFFRDKDGQYSSTRLVMVIWMITFSVVWAVVSIRLNTICDIPWTLAVVTAAILGVKLGQAFTEKKNGNNTNGNPT